MASKKSFSREELYDLVWLEPRRRLAPKLGISDVWISKICRGHNIPIPERGYWAKKKAGKKTLMRPLPPRFPGSSNQIEIKSHQVGDWTKELRDKPLSPPPFFEEEIESVRKRVIGMLGKVTVPRLSTRTHVLVQKLLDMDAERLKEREEKGYSWIDPVFQTSTDKRRLRLFNAIFLAIQKLGCKPGMSMSKYEREKEEASLYIGDQHISLKINVINNKQKKAKKIEPLSLSISGWNRNEIIQICWSDTDKVSLEESVQTIVEEIFVFSERLHREQLINHHQWLIEYKEELEEKEKQRKLEEERKVREERERQEQARIDHLLENAQAHQKAETIRKFVSQVHEKLGYSSEINTWSEWALNQAEKLDPLVDFRFLDKAE